MIYFLKGHPITQAVTPGTAAKDLNDGEVRRNPGEPSPEDAKTGDYKKPVVKWHGLTIRIENPAGSVRRGHNWETRMKYDYGYISNSKGVDGDEVDVYVGPHPETATMVYVVHQRKYGQWSKYDEDKCLIGFTSEDEAKSAYLAHYDDPRFLGPVTALTAEAFVAKVKETREQPAMIKSIVLFFKSNVKGHTRRTASGKVVYVNPYANKVASKRKDNSDKQLSLFADNDYVEPKKADDSPEAKLRALWDKQGVSKEKQDELIAQVADKAKPGAQVGPFKVAESVDAKGKEKVLDNQGRDLSAVKRFVEEGRRRRDDGERMASEMFSETIKNVPLPDWTEVNGIKVLRSGNSKFVAVPKNGKESAANYDIVDLEADEHTTTLKRDEVREWLWRAAKSEFDDSKDQGDLATKKQEEKEGPKEGERNAEVEGDTQSTQSQIDSLGAKIDRAKRRLREAKGNPEKINKIEREIRELRRQIMAIDEPVANDQPTHTDKNDGPKEGDRNAEGLVFRDGRWHRDNEKDDLQTMEVISDEDYKQAISDAKYLKDIVFSMRNLVDDDNVLLALSRELGKSGRDTILMDALNIDRNLAHNINNDLDAYVPHNLRAVDMEDAFDKFPELKRIVDRVKDEQAERLARRAAKQAQKEPAALDQLRAKIEEMGGKEKVASIMQQNKAQADALIDKFVDTLGLPRETVLAEFGLKLKGAKSERQPVAEKSAPLADEDNPNSPNYRYRDTGYVAGSRKESAANSIKQAAKSGRRVNVSEVDWEAIEENPREAKELIVKSNLFGEVEWDRLREEGMEPGAGFLIDRVYASIGTGPSEDTPQARKDYALGLQSLRSRLEACKSAGDVVKVIDEIRDETHGKMLLEGDAEKYQALSDLRLDIHKKIRPMEELNDKLYQDSMAANSEKYQAESEIRNRERRKWKVSDELREKLKEKTAAAEAAHNVWLEKIKESRPIIEGLRDFLRTTLTEMRAIENQAVERNARENPLTRAWATLGERFNAVINFRSSTFNYGSKRVSGSDAFRKHVVAAKNNRITDWSWAETKGEHKAPAIKKESVRFQLKVADKYERVGGRAVKPESTIELKNQFNLREVQSGNWVLRDAVSAKFHVENTAAAFADLADIVGVSDKDVSLNGRLAMAFGARGSGAKGWKDAAPRAHYEPVHRIINLTKMGGGGTLAHEWAHALDNIVSEAVTGKASDSSDYVTERPDLLPPGELRNAFMAVRSAMLDGNEQAHQTLKYSAKDIGLADYNINRQVPNTIAKKIKAAGNAERAVQAVDDYFKDHRMTPKIKKQILDWRRIAVAYHDRNPEGNEVSVKAGPTMSKFAAGAAMLDHDRNPYWSTPHEMFARAFQSYVEDSLESQGRKNDYLSVYADNKYHVDPLTGMQWKPYPEGEEREKINMAMERLLAVIKKDDLLAKAVAMMDKRELIFFRK